MTAVPLDIGEDMRLTADAYSCVRLELSVLLFDREIQLAALDVVQIDERPSEQVNMFGDLLKRHLTAVFGEYLTWLRDQS